MCAVLHCHALRTERAPRIAARDLLPAAKWSSLDSAGNERLSHNAGVGRGQCIMKERPASVQKVGADDVARPPLRSAVQGLRWVTAAVVGHSARKNGRKV